MAINFTLNSFGITNTRSVHEDTDYAIIGLSQNGKTLGTASKKIGNVNNGQHQVGLTVQMTAPAYNSTDEFCLAYLIVNHGGGKTADVLAHCESAMTQTGLLTFSAALAAMVQVQGGSVPASFSTPLRAADAMTTLWNLVKGQFTNLSTDRCDGPVVIDKFSWYGSAMADVELLVNAGNNWIYQGINSAIGCGSNSDYSATWTTAVVAAAAG